MIEGGTRRKKAYHLYTCTLSVLLLLVLRLLVVCWSSLP